MIDASILSTLTGVTTVIGVVCVLAYLFILKNPSPTNLSITDVLGQRHDPVALNELLKAFPTEEGKLKALRARLNFDRNQAVDLLKKVQSKVSVDDLNKLGAKSRDKRFLITAYLFFALAIIALISQIIISHGGNKSGTVVEPAAPTASQTESEVVSAGAKLHGLSPPPVPATADDIQAIEIRNATRVTTGPNGEVIYTLQNGDVLTVYPGQKDGSQTTIREAPVMGTKSR